MNRFQNSSVVDHYYSCNGEGETIQWLLNNNAAGGYSSQSVSNVFMTVIDNISVLSTLLSASTVKLTNTVMFVSILIASARNASINVEVACTNNIDIVRISNISLPKYYNSSSRQLLSSSNNDVILDYIVSDKISQNSLDRTYIVMCGSISSAVGLLVDDETAGFNSNDEVGQQHNVFNENNTGVIFQGVLFSRQSYGIIVVVIATELFDFNLSCASGNDAVHIQLKNVPFSLEILPSHSINMKRTSSFSSLKPSLVDSTITTSGKLEQFTILE